MKLNKKEYKEHYIKEKDFKRHNPGGRNIQSYGAKVGNHFEEDLQKLIRKMKGIIKRTDSVNGLRWIIGLDSYLLELEHGFVKKNKRNTNKTHNYSRGQIVMVELFGHFDTELTFLRPAIVLNTGTNNIKEVCVAPLTKSKIASSDDKSVQITSTKQVSYFHLKNLRYIDTARVRYTLKKEGKIVKATDNELDQIDDLIKKELTKI